MDIPRALLLKLGVLAVCATAGGVAASVAGPAGTVAGVTLGASFGKFLLDQVAAGAANIGSTIVCEIADAMHDRQSLRERGLQNDDVQRMMGCAVALVLEEASEDFPGKDEFDHVVIGGTSEIERGRAFIKAIQARIRKSWINKELDARYSPIMEKSAGTYFRAAPEVIKNEDALDPALWTFYLRDTADDVGLTADPVHQATLDAAITYAARRLTRRFAPAVWESAKRMCQADDPAWPGLVLHLLAEIRSEISDVKVAAFEAVRCGQAAEGFAEVASINARALRHDVQQLASAACDTTARMSAAVQMAQAEIVSELRANARDLADTLASFGEDVREIKAALAAFHLAHAPRLTLPRPNADDTRERFVFRNERLAVLGRDDELRELSAWLNDERSFSWDLWTGPAGAGKSRLALELCRQRTDWHRGFYDWSVHQGVRMDLWRPEADTLIVFDYVAEHAEAIGAMLAIFAERIVPGSVKVRCLLLERAAASENRPTARSPRSEVRSEASTAQLEAPWLNQLRVAAKASGANVTEAHARRDLNFPERRLVGVIPAAAVGIIAAEAAFANETITPEQLRARLAAALQIDRLLRPLFVAMTAEAVRERGATFDFSDHGSQFDALVDYINDKEWKHARARLDEHPSGRGPDHGSWARLVCLVTMCQGLLGLALDKVWDKSASLGLPTLFEWGNGSRYDLLVSGANDVHAPKLEPDVLGEGFVLWWLSTHTSQARLLIDAAWDLGMGEFVARAAHNFPAQVEASGLLAPRPGANARFLAAAHAALAGHDQARRNRPAVAARGHRLLLDETQPSLVREFGAFAWTQADMDATTLNLWEAAISQLKVDTSQDAAMRELWAKGLNNAIYHANADAAITDRLLERLEVLAKDHPEDAAVREPLASAIFNAFTKAGPDHARANRLLNRLEDLAKENPEDAAVLRTLAKGLTNAIADAEIPALADRHLRILEELAAKHPEDAEIREQVAGGLNNALANSGANHARADRLLERLEALGEGYPLDAAVREQLAQGLFNTFNHAGADLNRADRFLKRLETLANAHPMDVAVLEPLACGLFNSFNNAGTDLSRKETLLDRLEALATEHPQNVVVRAQLVSALTNAIVENGEDLLRADRLLGRLERQENGHPLDVTVREQLAKGLSNLIADAGENHARTDQLLDRLEVLTKKHPQEAALVRPLATSLFNACHNASGDHARVHWLLDRLELLSEEHSQDPEIRAPLAKALTNAIYHARADHAQADRLLDRLEVLADKHPQEAAMLETLAKGLSNAIAGNCAGPARGDRLLDRLEALANNHLQEHLVREALAKGLYNEISRAGADNARANWLLGRLEALAKKHPHHPEVQVIALRGCHAHFVGRLKVGTIAFDCLNVAMGLMAGLPDNTEARENVLQLLDLISDLNTRVKRIEVKQDLERRFSALHNAYRDRFKVV